MSTLSLTVRVARKTAETAEICSFELVSTDGMPLPAFEAGAHIDVEVPGETTLIRQYSLCNDPGERHRYVIGVLREPQGRGGSLGLHQRVQEGDVLRIGKPRQNFPLREGEGLCRLVGGGIGLTPILAMAWTLHRKARPFHLHICVRTPDHVPFRDVLAEAPFADRIVWHFSDTPQPTLIDFDVLMGCATTDESIYLCGPTRLLAAADQAAQRHGWDDHRLNIEHFGGTVSAEPGDRSFEVVLNRSQQVIPVNGHQTVAQALLEHGVALPLSCEQGICGTCLTKVLDGIPDHRDSYLLPNERERNDQFLPCCSRAHSPRLVLDI